MVNMFVCTLREYEDVDEINSANCALAENKYDIHCALARTMIIFKDKWRWNGSDQSVMEC